jgi:hypothetical protein
MMSTSVLGGATIKNRIFKGGLLIGVKNRHLRASYLYSNDREAARSTSNVDSISDVPGLEMYRKNSTRSKVSHNFAKMDHQQARIEPESSTSSMHYGNTGMVEGLQIPSTMESLT